jgi:signal transduction histidine kinase
MNANQENLLASIRVHSRLITGIEKKCPVARKMRKISDKLAITFGLLIFSAILVCGWYFYQYTKYYLDRELSQRLVDIAQTMSLQLDGDIITQLAPGNESGMTYRNLVSQLNQTKEKIAIKRVYIFDKNHRSLVDTQAGVPIGTEYLRLKFDQLELESVWQKKGMASVLFLGEDGNYYKSGYAPILVDGKVIAIIGVDASAAFLHILKRFRRNVLTFGLACIFISLAIVYVVSKTITNPVHKLVAAIENISSGDFKTEIKVQANGEIGFLGMTIEQMRLNILKRDVQMKLMLANVAHEIRNPLGGIELFADILAEELGQAERQQGPTTPNATTTNITNINNTDTNNVIANNAIDNSATVNSATANNATANSNNTNNTNNTTTNNTNIIIPAKEHLKKISKEVKKLNQIITEFLDFAKPNLPQKTDVSLEELIQAAYSMLALEFEGAEVEFRSKVNPLAKIFVDPEQFKRVFVNIFKNSLQSIQQGGVAHGKITVQSSENKAENKLGNKLGSKPGKEQGNEGENKVENKSGNKSGSKSGNKSRSKSGSKSGNKSRNSNGLVEITVSDNGPGIPYENLQRLFEPFFTTKEKGAGLGLAIVQKIVSDHGSSINIQSQKGGLTTAIIRVPVRQGASA